MTMPKRPTYRTIVAGVPNHIGEMKLKCRQPARKLYTETHDNSEADARLCNGRPEPASALGLVGEVDAKRNT